MCVPVQVQRKQPAAFLIDGFEFFGLVGKIEEREVLLKTKTPCEPALPAPFTYKYLGTYYFFYVTYPIWGAGPHSRNN